MAKVGKKYVQNNNPLIIMKLAIDGRVLTHKQITGVERYTIGLIEAFDKIGVPYDLIIPSIGNRYLQHFWQHIILPTKAKSYDILFCPGNIAPIWKPEKTKIVVTIHDLSFLYFPSAYSRAFRNYYRFAMPRILRISDAVLTVSDSEKQRILSQYPFTGNKLYAIHSGINTEFLSCNVTYEKGNYILYVGSLNEKKNFQGVIKGFYNIINKIDCKLLVIGGTSNTFKKNSKMRAILQEIPEDKILFKEYMDKKKLVGLYRKARLFLFPSFYEGFGFPPLEAMACGCPVVTSNTSSLPEVCGDAAYYVDPYSIENIAQGIYRVLIDENLRKTLIKKGLERVKLFCWKKAAKRILEVFEEVMRNK